MNFVGTVLQPCWNLYEDNFCIFLGFSFVFFPLWQAIKDEDPLLRLMLELLPEPLQEPFAGALAGMPCRKSFQEALQVPFRKP